MVRRRRSRSTVPTRIGAPTARAARSIAAAASGLRSGSMSEEFSGQITRSGCGARPAATSAASCSVRRTWLSSTARRWALKSRPRRGTLPWIAATVTVRLRSPGGAARSAASRRQRASGSERGTSAARDGAQPVDVGRTGARSDDRAPARQSRPASTANDSSGAPPIAASGSSGPSGWPNPTRPHGNPPNGHRDAQRLPRDPHAAAHSGAAGQPGDTTASAPASPRNSASSARQRHPRHRPDVEPVHGSSGSRKPSPNRKP